MAGGVNVKMGVSGVAQFKQSMNQAKQATKTLDAQLALTEKQFKASGDAESYMAEKTELLKAKMEQQESIVRNAEQALENMVSNGVERSSTAYQNLYREMLTAKGALVDTRQELQNVGTAGEDAATGVQDANAQLAQIGQEISFQNVTEGLGSITSGLGNIIKKAWEAGEALVRATLGAGAWADELQTTADVYSKSGWQITPEDLQRMRNTSRVIDTDVESIIAARDKLLKGLGGEDEDVFNFLHDNNIPTAGKNIQDVFWEVGDAIIGMNDDAKQQEAAMKAFGKSWADLKPLFTAGREEYEKTNASWSALNQQQIDNLTKMDDAYQTLQSELTTFKMQILEAFSGPLTEGMETLTGLMKEFNTYLQSEEGQAKLAQIGETISGLISGLTSIDPAEVVSGLQGVIDKVSAGLQWIGDNKDTVIGALKGIGIAFGALELATVATNIWRVVDGMKSLLGLGGGNGTGTTGTAAPAPSGGGFFTGVSNWFTATAGKAAEITATAGNAIPAIGDWFMNQTNLGRSLRDGTDVIEGLKKDVDEFTEGVQQNAETFEKDWNDNVLTQPGKNSILFWDNFWSNFMTGGSGWDWSHEETDTDWGDSYDLMEAIARSNERAESGNKSDSSSFFSTVQRAFAGMKVIMDGEVVGRLVAPTVNEIIAGEINQ